jgi:hypothetical protein
MELKNRMNAIAKYREVTLFGKRNYELHSDKIVVVGAGMGSYELEQTILLIKISPNSIRTRIRPSIAWISLTISILTGLLSVVLVREFAIRSAAVPGVLGIFSCSALIVAIATMKRVEYATFCSDDGCGNILLNVGRSGPERNQFENFVQKLVSQIESAKDVVSMKNANADKSLHSDQKASRIREDAQLIWDEYKYRHEHCWKLIFQITIAVIVVSVIPYTQETIARVVGEWIVALPSLGILLALFGSIRLYRELDLLDLLKKDHREFLKDKHSLDHRREGFLHHELGGFYVHVAVYMLGLLALSIVNICVITMIWLPYLRKDQ